MLFALGETSLKGIGSVGLRTLKTPVVKQQVGAPHEKPVTTLVVQVVLETLLTVPWYQRKALWSFYFQKERTSRKRQGHSDYLRKRLSKLKQAVVEEPKDLLFSVMLTVTFLFGATDLLKEREVKNFHRQTMSRLQIGRAPLTLSSGDSAASFLRTLMLRPAEEPYGTLLTRYDGSFASYLSGKKRLSEAWQFYGWMWTCLALCGWKQKLFCGVLAAGNCGCSRQCHYHVLGKVGFATRTEFYKKERSVLLRESTFYGTKLYPFLAPQSPWSSQLFKISKQSHLALEANVDEINMDKEIRNAVVSKLVKEQVEELDVEKKREIVKKGDKSLENFAKPPALTTQATSGEVQSSQGEVQLALSFAWVARQALQRTHMHEWAGKSLTWKKSVCWSFSLILTL